MTLTYTLGILGIHHANVKTVGYYEEIISSYWNRTPCMNVIFFASTRHTCGSWRRCFRPANACVACALSCGRASNTSRDTA
ncbi:MAG: hypothetical protein K2J51_01210 [Alistipes sp.]|nr:hypothetical protein [Alistipes sp.]